MLAAQLFGQQRSQIRILLAEYLGDQRRQFVLCVDGPALVRFAIEVNGQTGDHRDGQTEVDQLALDATVAAVGDAAGERQVAVEPGRQQRAAVDFNAQLPEALALQVRMRLDAQAGAVGMRTDQTHAVLDHRSAAELEGDERRIVARDVIAPARLQMPGVAFHERSEAGGLQALGETERGVERRGGCLKEFDQALVECLRHDGLRTAMAQSLPHRPQPVCVTGRRRVLPFRTVPRSRSAGVHRFAGGSA
ncbi:hypothetical protein D3C77_468610 [compost metagenome]